MYRIHPALPAYLAARWRTEDGAGYDGQRAAATRALVSAYADFGGWLLQQVESGDVGLAYTIIWLQQRTMGHLLGYALAGQFWVEALDIAEPLSGYWDGRGLSAEAAAWTDRVRLATEDIDGVPPGLDSAAGALWLFFVSEQARRKAHSGRLDTAERSYREILAILQAQPASPRQQGRVAVVYHQLGLVAQDRGRLDEAADWCARALAIREELGDRPGLAGSYHLLGNVAYLRGRLDEAADWYARALAIFEELGDRPGMAASYHQLGTVAQDRGRLDEAADWCARALAIREELGDRPGMATSYHQLGMVAQHRGRLDEAADWCARALAIREELGDRPGMANSYLQLGNVAYQRGRLDEAADWYARALAIFEELGDRPKMAASYQNLGTVAHERGRLDEAADWYARALAIREELGDRPGMATSYHQLGMIAQHRGRLDEAADWYARALAIREELGNRPDMALIYGQLGLLAEARGGPGQALEWMVRCVALFDDFPHPSTGPAPYHLARLTHQLGIKALEGCWQRVTGGLLPGAVRDYVHSYRPDLGDASEGADQ